MATRTIAEDWERSKRAHKSQVGLRPNDPIRTARGKNLSKSQWTKCADGVLRLPALNYPKLTHDTSFCFIRPGGIDAFKLPSLIQGNRIPYTSTITKGQV